MTARNEIATVLRSHSTPLGLGDDWPEDEYDCCAAEVLRVLLAHLCEWTDDIAGSKLALPDGGQVWLHRPDQIKSWLNRVLTAPPAPDPTGHTDHNDPYCETHCAPGIKHSQCGCTRAHTVAPTQDPTP